MEEFQNSFFRPLFFIIFRKKILFSGPYSILTGHTKVESVAYQVLSKGLPSSEGSGTLGDLTLNFPTFSKPILNLDFYIKTDQGSTQVSNIQENNVESCTNFRFCHQAPIFQLRLFLGPIFGQKIFSIKQTLKMDKKCTEKVLLQLQIAFFDKIKIFIFAKIWDSEVFSNLVAWWQNLRLVHNSTLFS